MARTRRYHPLVAKDLAAAVSHYDNISLDLGNRFRAAIRDRVGIITDRPGSLSPIHEQCRAALLDKFPYVILFEHERETITILGIFHAASDRDGWFERGT